MKLGRMTGKCVHQLLKKYEFNWPHGGAIINDSKIQHLKGHAPHTVSPIDLKLDTQVQLMVLYKKASWTIKVRHIGFFANLHKVKNSHFASTFWILTLSTPNLVHSFRG